MSEKKSSAMPGDVESLRRRSVAGVAGENKLLGFLPGLYVDLRSNFLLFYLGTGFIGSQRGKQSP